MKDAVHPVSGDVDTDDAALIAACRRGETAAYGRLVRRYQDRVYNLCRRMCSSREDAEDYTQEAFVRALQSLNQFAERSRFYTWVYRIAVNLIISARRKDGHRPSLSLDAPMRGGDGELTESRADGLLSAESRPDERAAGSERDAMVLHALTLLEEDQRAVIALRDMESLSYEEIAEILNVPSGTVKSRLHRARLALRDILAPMLGME